MLNRIGFPDETPCPDCGRPIEGEEDPIGIVYQCTSLDCGSTYTGDDLFPENYPPRSLPVKTPAHDPLAEATDIIRALTAERDTLRAALIAVVREYDPSEDSHNALTMRDIARDAISDNLTSRQKMAH